MAEVEAVLLAGKYNLRSQAQLAKRHGITCRTIRNYRRRLEAVWAKEIDTSNPEAERTSWLVRVRQAQSRCLEASELRALASFMALEARVLGIDQKKVLVEHTGHVGVLHASVETFARILPTLSPSQIEAMLLPDPPTFDTVGEVIECEYIPLLEDQGGA